MKAVAAEGWYSIFGVTPAGAFIWILWTIEAVIIVGGTTLVAAATMGGAVYCEECRCWCESTENALRFGIPEDGAQLDELRPDNFDPLTRLANVPVTDSYFGLDIWECRSCNETSALQVKFRAHSVDDNGDPHEETKDVTEVWSVMPRTLEKLKALKGQQS